MQSATTNVAKNKKRKRGAGGGDEILEIAKEVERVKKTGTGTGKAAGGSGEEVVLKGTGRAVERVLELALFLQGKEVYDVKLRTGSVKAVDDITVTDTGQDEDGAGAGGDEAEEKKADPEVPETRVRYTSVLEVHVRLR